MPLVSCPLVCLFSHVPVHHNTINTKQWLNEHKLEQFTVTCDVLFVSASTIKSIHPFSIWHSVFTKHITPTSLHSLIALNHARDTSSNGLYFAALSASPIVCFSSSSSSFSRYSTNGLSFPVLGASPIVCFSSSSSSFSRYSACSVQQQCVSDMENGNEIKWCQNKNKAFISSLTSWFWCPFAFFISVSFQCVWYLFF